ncbi:hypothetical protein M0811_13057 [Anaeramoeba ignava]|uniref:Uncharacterized protein n=1 Tax=Anaeramoeba ignava TaxID=1746090 RepID=A0A9Q0L7N2_ANAIG|nr:hypothetical protein M0811_13057 [Anaeramoeba ignava]
MNNESFQINDEYLNVIEEILNLPNTSKIINTQSLSKSSKIQSIFDNTLKIFGNEKLFFIFDYSSNSKEIFSCKTEKDTFVFSDFDPFEQIFDHTLIQSENTDLKNNLKMNETKLQTIQHIFIIIELMNKMCSNLQNYLKKIPEKENEDNKIIIKYNPKNGIDSFKIQILEKKEELEQKQKQIEELQIKELEQIKEQKQKEKEEQIISISTKYTTPYNQIYQQFSKIFTLEKSSKKKLIFLYKINQESNLYDIITSLYFIFCQHFPLKENVLFCDSQDIDENIIDSFFKTYSDYNIKNKKIESISYETKIPLVIFFSEQNEKSLKLNESSTTLIEKQIPSLSKKNWKNILQILSSI